MKSAHAGLRGTPASAPRRAREGLIRVRALVVEDNVRLAKLLGRGLDEAGYQVEVVHDGRVAKDRLDEGEYDVVVLDWMLPGMDGLTLLQEIRADGDDTPVLMLTARDDIEDRVEGLDGGADDYLAKPFDFEELLARLRALRRRRVGAAANVIRVADLEVDMAGRVSRRGGVSLDLTAREFAILECLVLHRGRVVSRDQLLAHAFDHGAERASNVIDVHIGHLRRKLEREGPALIHTRRGEGYLLREPA